MFNDRPGITFKETMTGWFALGETDPQSSEEQGKVKNTILSIHVTINICDVKRFISDCTHQGSIAGHINFTPFGENIPAKSGVFNLFSPADNPKLKLMVYELAFEFDGQDYYLAGKKEVRDDPGFDLWRDTTTLYTQLHQGKDRTYPIVGAGILSLNLSDLAKLVSTMHVTNVDSAKEKALVLMDFGQFFMGNIWETYF